jgi:hypothetical protein
MSIIYEDLSTLLNTSVWEVHMEDAGQLKVPYYFKKYPERKPLYYNESGMTTTMLTINQIITLCCNGTVFAIAKHEDYVSILKYFNQYMEELSHAIVGLPESSPEAIYYEKCKQAKRVLEELGDVVIRVEQSGQLRGAPTMAELLARMLR